MAETFETTKEMNKKQSTKLKIVAIVVVLVALVLFISVKFSGIQKNSTKQENFTVTRTEVDKSKLPEKFPIDIPIEAKAKVTDNYNALATNGMSQATRRFETAKTLDANFKLYSDFFSKNGWQTTNTINQPKLKIVFVAKGGTNAQVTMAENSVTKKKTVDISVTYIP